MNQKTAKKIRQYTRKHILARYTDLFGEIFKLKLLDRLALAIKIVVRHA